MFPCNFVRFDGDVTSTKSNTQALSQSIHTASRFSYQFLSSYCYFLFKKQVPIILQQFRKNLSCTYIRNSLQKQIEL